MVRRVFWMLSSGLMWSELMRMPFKRGKSSLYLSMTLRAFMISIWNYS